MVNLNEGVVDLCEIVVNLNMVVVNPNETAINFNKVVVNRNYFMVTLNKVVVNLNEVVININKLLVNLNEVLINRSYMAQCAVLGTVQNFTPWQTCSFQCHLNFSGKSFSHAAITSRELFVHISTTVSSHVLI